MAVEVQVEAGPARAGSEVKAEVQVGAGPAGRVS